MTEENLNYPEQPLIQPAESDDNIEDTSAKNCLFSWLSFCFPVTTAGKEISPTRSLDEFSCPTFDQVKLEEYLKENDYNPLLESSNLNIYYQDLQAGNGSAVMMENDTDFELQKVKFDYNCYNRSAELVRSNRSPVTCYFCRNHLCSGLEIGIQGMREGGIRRILIHPPQHTSSPSNFGVHQDYEIFHLKLLKVRPSLGCKIRNNYPNQSSKLCAHVRPYFKLNG